MTHEERLAEIKKLKMGGCGMIGGVLAMFGGLFGGLQSSAGIGGALGAAFGCSSGLVFGSMGLFELAKEIEAIDAETEKGNGVDVEAS